MNLVALSTPGLVSTGMGERFVDSTRVGSISVVNQPPRLT